MFRSDRTVSNSTLAVGMKSLGEPSDEALVARAREGDRSAFEALVRRHQRSVYHLCLRYCRDHDVASDLAQRAFIRAFEKVTELRDGAMFRSWVLRIAAHYALNHLRDHSRFVPEDARIDEPTTTEASNAHAQLEADEEALALRAAVATLPTMQRMTVELRAFEGMPFKEIAEALGTSEGASKVSFHLAVRKLRAFLSRDSAGKAGQR